MSHSPKSAAEGPSNLSAAAGQLATPALSPISEHGNGPHSFADITKTLSGDSDTADQRYGAKKPATNDIPRVRRRSSEAKTLKLSHQQLHDLTSSPESLPLRHVDDDLLALGEELALSEAVAPRTGVFELNLEETTTASSPVIELPSVAATPAAVSRPITTARSPSLPLMPRKFSSSKTPKGRPQLPPLKTEDGNSSRQNSTIKPSPNQGSDPSPMPSILPIPPLSLPTYLHLELSSDRPSPLYIHRSATADFPYESSKVKFDRLLNFIRLPPQLEQVLVFGAIACLDAWLYTFTILPLRFLKAVAILIQWVGRNAMHEARDLGSFVYSGVGRVWQRKLRRATPVSQRRDSGPITSPSFPDSRRTSVSEIDVSGRAGPEVTGTAIRRLNGHAIAPSPVMRPRGRSAAFRHRRTRSTPSALLPNHKADLLQGLLIILSCAVLMYFDASRMYHSIRGQAAIKLYVIYNVLEVFDRLFSAIGQDVLECLFSKETLERDSDGRSKIFRPAWVFALALVYNVIHSTALFYQVVTLNVAVNSYSNALLTLLMSNQFVEIKGTVFKKFEKENLFQLTCADVVERFQLWLMLSIIALRNIVEVGGLSISISSALGNDGGTSTDGFPSNGTGVPLVSGFVIPKAFTLFPKWTGEVLGPFLIVLGSEALVDWCKHAYITKFNNVKPNVYGRFLDVLAKDYYTHAFADQNLTKRLGLPVVPLSCLFIRACMQTYHMFLATHMPLPIPSAATSISLDPDSASSSPATMAALQHIDAVFRRALGRSTFGAGAHSATSLWWSLDDVIALLTMVIVFLAIYLILLAFKLLLGMLLLSYSRNRYKSMREREHQSADMQGVKRIGGWGAVEVGDEKRKWIYEDDPEGLRELEKKERRGREKAEKSGGDLKLEGVERYSMVAKRIW